VVYGFRGLVFTRFPGVRPILIERAFDWSPAVRAEVASVLATLGSTRFDLVGGVINDILDDGRIEGLWTVLTLSTVCRPGQRWIYQYADHKAENRKMLENHIRSLLADPKSDLQTVSVLLESLVLHETPEDSSLIVIPMTAAIDSGVSTAKQLLAKWQHSGTSHLERITEVIEDEIASLGEMRLGREDHLLQTDLDDDKALQVYAATLPADHQKGFWARVAEARQVVARDRERRRDDRVVAALVIFFVLVLVIALVRQIWL
jgi:hypothetical protein